MNFGLGRVLDPTVPLQKTLTSVGDLARQFQADKLKEEQLATENARANATLKLAQAKGTREEAMYQQALTDKLVQEKVGAVDTSGVSGTDTRYVRPDVALDETEQADVLRSAADRGRASLEGSTGYQSDLAKVAALESAVGQAPKPAQPREGIFDVNARYAGQYRSIDDAYDRGEINEDERDFAKREIGFQKRTDLSNATAQNVVDLFKAPTQADRKAKYAQSQVKQNEAKLTELGNKINQDFLNSEKSAIAKLKPEDFTKKGKAVKTAVSKDRNAYVKELKAEFKDVLKGADNATKAAVNKRMNSNLAEFDERAAALQKASQEMSLFEGKTKFKAKIDLASKKAARDAGLTSDSTSKGYASASKSLENSYKAQLESMTKRHEEDYMFDSSRQEERDELNAKFDKLRSALENKYNPL